MTTMQLAGGLALPQENPTRSTRAGMNVGLIEWTRDGNGIGDAIFHELRTLGHHPTYFSATSPVFDRIDVALLFGPFGKILPVLAKIWALPAAHRPLTAFWNTEGLPDLRIPWACMKPLSLTRSWLGRATNPLLQKLDSRLIRFRYLGDFLYAHQRGGLDVFADISAVYANFFDVHGIPTLVAPFGSHEPWYADLHLERDIDVLWMGKRATRRRSQLLDQLRMELRRHGVAIHMVDNEEHPFVFGEERTQLLNRSKITLNLLRTWYDENSLRICMAAPNRSLIISEPLLAHVPQYQAGIHYVSAPIERLASTICHYLQHEAERRQIVNNAYQLATTELTMFNSIKIIMDALQRTGA